MSDMKPAPQGVTLKIPKVWNNSLVGSAQNSLTDPSVDEPVITISASQIDTLGGMQGQDEINFLVEADLTNLGYVANVSVAIAWDPATRSTAPLIFQSNLPSQGKVRRAFRTSFLPKYPYLRAVGEHEVHIIGQLREVTTNWEYADGDYTSFTEFPRIGDLTIRKIKVNIVP